MSTARIVGVLALILSQLTLVPKTAATPACESTPDYRVGRFARQVEISPRSELLCGIHPAEVLREVEIGAEAIPRAEVQPGASYLVEASDGRLSVWQPAADSNEPSFAEPAIVWPLRFEETRHNLAKSETNRCHRAPPVEAGSSYLAFKGLELDATVEPVIARVDVRSKPFEAPDAPNIDEIKPERFPDACSEHGFFVARVPDLDESSPVWTYRWVVRDPGGTVVQRGIGPRPYAIGNAQKEDERFKAPSLLPAGGDEGDSHWYVPGQEYTLTVRAVDRRGEVSEPVTVDFTFERTGDGMWGSYGLVLTFLYGLLIIAAPFLSWCAVLTFLIGSLGIVYWIYRRISSEST